MPWPGKAFLLNPICQKEMHNPLTICVNQFKGTVKLSRIRPFCGRVPLNLRLGINDLVAAEGCENAAKLLNLTSTLRARDNGCSTTAIVSDRLNVTK